MSNKQEQQGFVLGIIYASWFLHRGYGEDTLAENLLLECGESIDALQRIARREEYHFKRGFWATVRRRRERARAA